MKRLRAVDVPAAFEGVDAEVLVTGETAESADYHVFLLSRIRERFTETGDNDEAVAYGVGSTARLITGAALIFIAVFACFAVGDLVMFQQMGFGWRSRC